MFSRPVNAFARVLSNYPCHPLLPSSRRASVRALENRITHNDNQETRMLNELKSQRITLSIEVDRARQWRSSAALDQIKKGLEARLTALDKAIKAEVDKQG